MGGKFKVGDRVRRTTASDWPEQYGEVGKEYTVLDVSRDGNPTVIKGQPAATSSAFELVSPVWVPKVGDRVVVLDNITPCGEPIKKYEVGKEYEVTYMCKDSNGGDAVMLLGHHQYLRPDQYAKPATLTIEPGKFYTTRDGRKVGPMRQRDGFLDASGWHYNPTGECCYRGISGDMVHPEHDLVALWPEPSTTATAAPVSAQVDAIAYEYGSGGVANDNGPDAALTATISGDASALDAEIDRVKRRLKKLAKRAKKLGISLEYDLRDAA